MSENKKIAEDECSEKKEKIIEEQNTSSDNKEVNEQDTKKEDNKEDKEKSEKNPLEKIKEDFEKQKNSFMRLAAEYDNFRKRSSKEKDSIYKDATAKAVETLLPVLDSLEFALKAKDTAPSEYQKGLEMMRTQFDSAFEKLGVSSFGEEGEEFDPNLHNAVSHIDDETVAENAIIEVFQTGYKIEDRVIRHAMVKVAN